MLRVSRSIVTLAKNSNQARGLAEYAKNFLKSAKPGPKVLERVKMFHTDSVICGLSALALNTNAPHVLRNEALTYTRTNGAFVFGSDVTVAPEKAICANSSAVREWDSNGTVFGYNERLPSHRAGEFGHNDFYPVAIAAAQISGLSGKEALMGMLLTDEIRGRLCEVFSLKSYKIDHVVHGAIASAVTYGAMLGASVDQIESAIGMVVAHYIPFRAIRAGKQLSDSKGASAALSTEVAILSMQRAMNGFLGPRDIFRNPEAIFRLFQKTDGDAPFDIVLSDEGSDFAVMGMHFKLGLYEHQAASAIAGLVQLLHMHPDILNDPANLRSIKIVSYEPAFSIIGDPAKRNPTTRQSADHSMVYMIGRIVQKAFAFKDRLNFDSYEELWKDLMLTPLDYTEHAIFDKDTRRFMELIQFEHGGQEYDSRYPEGIPTKILLEYNKSRAESEMMLFPPGHARHRQYSLDKFLDYKFKVLGELALDDPESYIKRLNRIEKESSESLRSIYSVKIKETDYKL